MADVKRGLALAGAAGLLLVAAAPADAQKWGRERWSRDGVCFYQDVDFRGEYFCIRSGEDLRSLPEGMNDRISSMRLFGRTEVTVFRDDNFKGGKGTFDGDVPDFRKNVWNDRISSIRVRTGSGSGSASSGDEDPDKVITRAYRDILKREPDSAGLRLYRRHMLDDDWSEAQVREALRSSPENAMTRAKAEDIVNSAYRSVLRRDADAGARGYVDRVMRDHWTQADVERELRKSPEYRNR